MNEVVPNSQKSPVERQYVVKTKTIGSTGSEVPDDSFRARLQFHQKQQQQEEENSSEKQADKARADMLERMGERRHLKYEVIDEAALVQVSVINSEDGTVVRKVPPDKVVGLVVRMRKNKKTTGFDLKA